MDSSSETWFMLETANTSQCLLISSDWKSHTCTSFGTLSHNRLSGALSCISKMHTLPQTTTQNTYFKTYHLREDLGHAVLIHVDPLQWVFFPSHFNILSKPFSTVNLSLQFLDWMKKFPSAQVQIKAGSWAGCMLPSLPLNSSDPLGSTFTPQVKSLAQNRQISNPQPLGKLACGKLINQTCHMTLVLTPAFGTLAQNVPDEVQACDPDKVSPQRQQQGAGWLQPMAKQQILVEASLHVLLMSSFRDTRRTACSSTLVILDLLQQSCQCQERDLGKSSNTTATGQ